MTTYHPPVKRKLAFTVYPKLIEIPTDEADCGRVIIAGQSGGNIAQGEWLEAIGDVDAFLGRLNPQDILWVPLYVCDIDHMTQWPAARLADYDAHIDILREAAPRVQAIMIGNMGCEVRFHTQRPRPMLGQWELEEARAFVDHNAALVRAAGGRPCFGTLDWDLLCDCYGDQALAEIMRQWDALQVCFCGYTMVPGTHYEHDNGYFARQQPWIATQGDEGLVRLRAYIGSMDIISGVCSRGGFEHENDCKLAEFGFLAGTSGGMICKRKKT